MSIPKFEALINGKVQKVTKLQWHEQKGATYHGMSFQVEDGTLSSKSDALVQVFDNPPSSLIDFVGWLLEQNY